ncbi:MAG: universal stress protein [Desulfurivibrio sp.]|nr:universal stress protein [Desulfurivibrio sp.]
MQNFIFPVHPGISTQKLWNLAHFAGIFQPEKIYLLLVAPPQHSRQLAWLKELEQEMADQGLPVERLLRQGHIPSQITAAARTTRSTICFIKKWKNPLKMALAGSVVSDVVRMSDEPVLIHKKSLTSAASEQLLTNVMYATSFKHTDEVCVRYIQHPAFKAKRLVLLHVGRRAPDPEAEGKRREQVNANLEDLARQCHNGFETIEKKEVVGLGVARKILRHARLSNIDLLIIGKIDSNGLFSSFTGSTAEAVYNSAPCSVLVIPGGR